MISAIRVSSQTSFPWEGLSHHSHGQSFMPSLPNPSLSPYVALLPFTARFATWNHIVYCDDLFWNYLLLDSWQLDCTFFEDTAFQVTQLEVLGEVRRQVSLGCKSSQRKCDANWLLMFKKESIISTLLWHSSCGRLLQYQVEVSLLGVHKHSVNIYKMAIILVP